MVNNTACSVIKNSIIRGLGKKFLHKPNHPSPPRPASKEIPRDIVFIPSIQ